MILDTFRLDGRVAVVTGSSRGLGQGAALALAEAGADLVDVSSGGNVLHQSIPVGPLYQVPLAEQVAQDSGVPVSAVGLITTPQQAEEVVSSGRADAVMLARELLRDPHFALRAAHELGAEIDYWPAQYVRARLEPGA